MKDEIARSRLAAVPPEMREHLMAVRAHLPAGAISVVGRFFETLMTHGEHPTAPSRGTFEATCRTEATLALLLRTLTAHAPDVCLAEGRELRRVHYRNRSGGLEPQVRQSAGAVVLPKARGWPEDWLALLPGLLDSGIKDSSIKAYIHSINRCAAELDGMFCSPTFGWLMGWELGQALLRAGVAPITAAGHIGALVCLGRHGGVRAKELDGLRSIRGHLKWKARRGSKRKEDRINELMDRGGYAAAIEAIITELDRAGIAPDWSIDAATSRATAAILAVAVNMPARTGDVAVWRLGHELERMAWGEWRLAWTQGKTGSTVDAGVLWPEVGEVLDLHILGGRPHRLVGARFEELQGSNWLTLTDDRYASNWPSSQAKRALGVPLHDLRTLAADYLRLHDPSAAPDIVGALLGHRTAEAGEEYRALCVDEVGQRRWHDIRKEMAEKASPP